ncbi:MAG: glycosyl transferase [Robiginitomaculum sp.]|nr:MAG: glycosyl transferase [Robiginitomaculum sp.]
MLSVIIPTLNAGKYLKPLLHQVGPVCQDIVVTDGGSRDETLALALASGARLAVGCKGRGWQLARGAKWARGDWLFFIHADTVLSDGWAEAVESHMRDFPEKSGYFRYALDAQGVWPKLVSGFVWLRSKLLALPYGDQGLLISRALYEEIGGFPDWDLFEDVAIIRALGRQRLRQLPARAITSAARYETQGYLRRGLRNLSLIIRFTFGADPQKLKALYYK